MSVEAWPLLSEFSILDGASILIFLGCWLGMNYYTGSPRHRGKTLSGHMDGYRLRWMQQLQKRDPRMVDTMVQATLLNGVAFFASTSILLVGGLMAMLGATDQVIELVSVFPVSVTRALWEIKVLALALVFIYAFFKFARSYRLFNYITILLGAVPPPEEDGEGVQEMVTRMSALHSLAASHFTLGLRAYFYALALLGWLVHPALLIVTSFWITWVVYRREFRSRFMEILNPQ